MQDIDIILTYRFSMQGCDNWLTYRFAMGEFEGFVIIGNLVVAV